MKPIEISLVSVERQQMMYRLPHIIYHPIARYTSSTTKPKLLLRLERIPRPYCPAVEQDIIRTRWRNFDWHDQVFSITDLRQVKKSRFLFKDYQEIKGGQLNVWSVLCSGNELC